VFEKGGVSMRNFELEKLKFEREQLKLALDKAVNDLDQHEVLRIVDQLGMDPLELKDLQSKTSQMPNLYKKNPEKYPIAKKLADAINQKVSEARHDKSEDQQDFLSAALIHTIPGTDLNSDIDEIR
jgi:hypothetical protein